MNRAVLEKIPLNYPVERPLSATDDVMAYLYELVKSGETSMYRARPYLMHEFDMSAQDAKDTLFYWMETFDFKNAPKTTRWDTK